MPGAALLLVTLGILRRFFQRRQQLDIRYARRLLGAPTRISSLALLLSLPLSLLFGCPVPPGECDTGTCVDDTGDTEADAGAGLIGIGYNDTTEHNELRSVDPATAVVTTLTSFDFDSGFWSGYIVTDPDAGTVYAVSSADTLYSIAMDGSAVTTMGTLSMPMQNMGLGTE